MNASCKINLVCIFDFVLLGYFDFPHNSLAEIIEKHACIYFLLYQLSFLGMQCIEPNGILEFSKRGFLAPSHIVYLYDFFHWKLIPVQIGNDGFVGIFGN